MPRWFLNGLLRLIGHWYDPIWAKRQDETTEHAMDVATERRSRADAAIEAYRRESVAERGRR